jgi:hypothetical protein
MHDFFSIIFDSSKVQKGRQLSHIPKNYGYFCLLNQQRNSATMRFILFRTNKPRRFSYRPRYYDADKEALERRKAEMGLEAKLTEQEARRMRMSARWRKQNPASFEDKYKRTSFIIYGSVVLLGIYVIFFTDFIDNLIRAFGLTI